MFQTPDGFNCQHCAAKPELQKIQGCFVPTERSVASVGSLDFYRCPVAYQSGESLRIVRAYNTGLLDHGVNPNWTAKYYAALEYVDYLNKLKKAEHGN